MEPMTPNGQNMNQNFNFTPLQTEQSTLAHNDLVDALLYTQDLLERALIPFVLLDDTAKQLMQELPRLSLSEISIGIQKKHLTLSGKSILNMLIPKAEWSKVNINFMHKEVPIILWIIEGDYFFFKYPDVRFFMATEFYVPNPFRLYWKERDLIK